MDPSPVPVPGATPSLKALGKRRLEDSPPPDPASSSRAESPAVKKLKQSAANGKGKGGDKRVTRSSLGGAGDQPSSLARDEASSPPLSLPRSTWIWLSLKKPPGLAFHPPPDPLALAAAAPVVTDPAQPPADPVPVVPPPPPEPPQFRLLGLEDSFSRSRHGGPAEQTDTSDAHYARLHRFPEVLEKRSARLERDRLIHERSKLILEIEEMRGRGWVYQGMQGGKGEEHRKRKLQEGEERLKRYDALLPNQPRKSGFLNLGSHVAPASNGANSDSAANTSRSNSPMPSSHHPPTHSQSHHPSRRDQPARHHSTPLSASGDGGTTIRIKFAAGANGTASAPSPLLPPQPRFSGRGPSRASASGRGRYEEREGESDDDDKYEVPVPARSLPQHTKAPKRNRKAEQARAAERTRLGLPPRSSIDKAARGRGRKKRPMGKGSGNPEMDRDSANEVEGEEDASSSLTEELSSDEEEEDEDGDDQTNRAVVNVGAGRLRLPDSFFSSEALRDSVALAANAKSGRRSSGRVLYAFGTRIPDQALARRFDFLPRGGEEFPSLESEKHLPLEEMVRRRADPTSSSSSRDDAAVTWVDGVVVPRSALAVLADGPLQWREQPRSSPPPAAYPPLYDAVPPPPTTAGANPPTPTPMHGHGTRHEGSKRTVVTLSTRGAQGIKVRIKGMDEA